MHISGIARTDLPPGALSEPDRGFVFEADRADNIGQLRQLRAAGYAGVVSFEPFDPATQENPEIARLLAESLDFVRAALSA